MRCKYVFALRFLSVVAMMNIVRLIFSSRIYED
jgi:hypothetical protein